MNKSILFHSCFLRQADELVTSEEPWILIQQGVDEGTEGLVTTTMSQAFTDYPLFFLICTESYIYLNKLVMPVYLE